jgi:hypothetical protein
MHVHCATQIDHFSISASDNAWRALEESGMSKNAEFDVNMRCVDSSALGVFVSLVESLDHFDDVQLRTENVTLCFLSTQPIVYLSYSIRIMP